MSTSPSATNTNTSTSSRTPSTTTPAAREMTHSNHQNEHQHQHQHQHPHPPPLQTGQDATARAPADDDNTSPSRTLTSALSPTKASPTSPHAVADAARAMRHANEWKPIFNRRQSWSREDQKRELLMKGVADDGDCAQGVGFSEKC